MISRLTLGRPIHLGFSIWNWTLVVLAAGILLAGFIGLVDQDLLVAALMSGVILAGTGATGLILSAKSHAHRRNLSMMTVRSVTIESSFYQRSMAALRADQDTWYAAGAVERALSASDPGARQLGHDVEQLLDFYRGIAIGISQGAFDEPAVRFLLQRDLQAMQPLVRGATSTREDLQPVTWLADRWHLANDASCA